MSQFKESKCADGGHSFNRDFSHVMVQGHIWFLGLYLNFFPHNNKNNY